ncbi:MAG: helix-turn-helix domain-containing protein [Steroidobacter sp.]
MKNTTTGVKRIHRAPDRRSNRPAKIDPYQFYSIDESSAALDSCRAILYNMIADGKLRAVKHNNRTKIAGAEIIRFVESMMSEVA